MLKVCPICNKEFKTYSKTQVYCSRDCWGESRWKQYPKYICDNCGEEFRRESYKVRGKHKYCSIKCSSQVNGKLNNKKGRNYKVFTCKWCGKELINVNYKKELKFCNVSCANYYRWEEKRKNK